MEATTMMKIYAIHTNFSNRWKEIRKPSPPEDDIKTKLCKAMLEVCLNDYGFITILIEENFKDENGLCAEEILNEMVKARDFSEFLNGIYQLLSLFKGLDFPIGDAVSYWILDDLLKAYKESRDEEQFLLAIIHAMSREYIMGGLGDIDEIKNLGLLTDYGFNIEQQ